MIDGFSFIFGFLCGLGLAVGILIGKRMVNNRNKRDVETRNSE